MHMHKNQFHKMPSLEILSRLLIKVLNTEDSIF